MMGMRNVPFGLTFLNTTRSLVRSTIREGYGTFRRYSTVGEICPPQVGLVGL